MVACLRWQLVPAGAAPGPGINPRARLVACFRRQLVPTGAAPGLRLSRSCTARANGAHRARSEPVGDDRRRVRGQSQRAVASRSVRALRVPAVLLGPADVIGTARGDHRLRPGRRTDGGSRPCNTANGRGRDARTRALRRYPALRGQQRWRHDANADRQGQEGLSHWSGAPHLLGRPARFGLRTFIVTVATNPPHLDDNAERSGGPVTENRSPNASLGPQQHNA